MNWYRLVTAKPDAWANNVMTVVLGAGVAVVGMNVFTLGQPNLEQRLLASLSMAIALLPFGLWYSGVDDRTAIMPIFIAMYCAYFLAPIFMLRNIIDGSTESISQRSLTTTLIFILLGQSALLLSYYGPQIGVLRFVLPKIELNWGNENRQKQIAKGMILIGMFAYLLCLSVTKVNFIVVCASDLCLIGLLLLMAFQLVGKLDNLTTWLLWLVLIPFRLAIGLSTGGVSNAFLPGMILVLAYATIKHKMPWKVLALGFVALLIIRPAMEPFREMTWGGMKTNVSRLEKLELESSIIYDVARGALIPYDDIFQLAWSRLAHVQVFGEVVEDTPALVPYWNGQSYRALAYKLIPRFLWPDKPKEDLGQEFGHRYGMLSEEDDHTAINLAQLVECYANFGTVGIVLGMFILGCFYSVLQLAFIHPGMEPSTLAVCIYLIGGCFIMESNASLVIGGVFARIVFIFLANVVLRRDFLSAA